jgi:two-component system nitrogen regulation response regulator NtrX
MVTSEEIDEDELKKYITGDRSRQPGVGVPLSMSSLKDARDTFERDYIINALKRNQGNVTITAKDLDIERTNLHRKIRQYNIDADKP